MKTLTAQFTLTKHIKSVEIVFFTKHLATMLKAGIPINEALETLQKQTRHAYFQKVLSEIIDDLTNGSALADALKKHPSVFDQFYVSMVEVGEEAGSLEENLLFLADQLTKDLALKKKIQGAMLYPGLVFFATIAMSGFISFFVLPSLVDFFNNLNVALPLPTRILLGFATIMKNYGALIAIGVVGLVALTKIFVSLPGIKPIWHRMQLRLPLIGRLIAYGQLARFGRNLGILLRSGVPISRSLGVTTQTLSNVTYQNELQRVLNKLESGKNIGDALEKVHADIFPPLVSKMITVGEKTGNLDETLMYLATFYEEEIDAQAKNFSTVLEPILLLGIGLMVGFVALAIISPIYELTGSIRR